MKNLRRSKNKILFFLTSSYPFDKGESFVENEIHDLEKVFDKIFIICSPPQQLIKRYVPSNSESISFEGPHSFLSKLRSAKFFFSKLFWQEIFFIHDTLNLPITLKKINILSVELLKSFDLADFLRHIIKKNNYNYGDIFIYSYWNDYKAISASLLKQKYPKIKAIARAHGWDIYFERNTESYLPFKPFIFSNLDKIFFISESGMATALKLLKVPAKTNFSISRLGTYSETLPKFYGNKGKIIIVSCSSIIPVKRLCLLVDAISLINNIHIEWNHFGDGIERENVEKYAFDNLNSKKNINYRFMGFQANCEILRFYAENTVDLFINVSSSEGIPVSIMEAMSAGIPVVATNVGGNSEIVKDGQNGFVISSNGTPFEVSEIILKFHTLSETDIFKMREIAYNIWNEKYNAEKNYTKFIEQILNV